MHKLKDLWPIPVAAVLVGAIFLASPPFFGFMDDLTYLSICRDAREIGTWRFLSDWLSSDYANSGRIRPFLPLMALVFYGPFGLDSLSLHLANGIFHILLFLLISMAFYRLWRVVYPEAGWPKAAFLTIFFLLLLFFPWSHLMVSLPALQEKQIFLAGSAALWLFTAKNFFSWSIWLRIPLALALICLGSFTRETFILFFPALLAASWTQERKQKQKVPKETIFYLLSMIALVIAIWWLGKGNQYKGKFGLDTMIHTLQNSRSIWLFFALALSSALAVIVSRPREQTLFNLFPQFFPALSVLGFVFLMAPWGTGGYLNTVAAPFFSACLLTLLPKKPEWLMRRKWILHTSATFILFIFGALLLLDSTVKQDVKRALESSELKKLARSQQPIIAPCYEGAGYLRHYAEQFFGYHLEVRVPQSLEAARKEAGNKATFWFLGKHLSCWPSDFDPDTLINRGEAEVVWQGRHQWSHRIIKIN